LGIHGTTEVPVWIAVASIDGQRVRLPSEFAKLAGVDGVTPNVPIDCWLLVIKPGRFKLQRQSPPATEGPIGDILRHWEALALGDPEDETDERIALRAILLPCVATWHERGPRINLPKEIFQLAVGDQSHIYLMSVAGGVELWFPTKLQQAVSVPLSDVL
jgi:hypothetical protein